MDKKNSYFAPYPIALGKSSHMVACMSSSKNIRDMILQ
jgi:hypothetical protein